MDLSDIFHIIKTTIIMDYQNPSYFSKGQYIFHVMDFKIPVI